MAGITTFLDPTQLPGRTQEQKTFDTAVAYVMQNWPTWGAEVNATWAAFNAALASVNAIAAGGAYALPYTFDSATADADPGAGKLRLSSATQNASTTMRLDVLANNQDVSSILDKFDASTSTVKGSIRLVKLGDTSRWLTFDVTSRAAPTGYRNITVANTGGSAANPFIAGDAVMLFFQRNGDMGAQGAPAVSGSMFLLGSATVSTAVANIDFLNIFSSAYDKYIIDIQGVVPSGTDSLKFRLAFAGIVGTTGYFQSGDTSTSVNTGISLTFNDQLTDSMGSNFVVEVRDVNNPANVIGIGVRGNYFRYAAGSDNAYVGTVTESGNRISAVASGFRLLWSGGRNFTKGTIRVFGIKNS